MFQRILRPFVQFREVWPEVGAPPIGVLCCQCTHTHLHRMRFFPRVDSGNENEKYGFRHRRLGIHSVYSDRIKRL